ncbi:MAG: hypothetical protein JO180_05860 [Gemmatirosa sp.]|nr:hypothetical protein [Gemmatirosa sp.]
MPSLRPVLAIALLVGALGCADDPAAAPTAPVDPPGPPGVTVRYDTEHAPFAPLPAACDAAEMDRRRAAALAIEPIGTDWTAAEREVEAQRLRHGRYAVQDADYAWLVDTTAVARDHLRFRRGQLRLGLRPGVTPDDVQGSLQAVAATTVSVTAASGPPSIGVTVPAGAERPAVLALLTDCRIRWASLDAVPLATLP